LIANLVGRIYAFLLGLLIRWGLPRPVFDFGAMIVAGFVVAIFIALVVLYLIWMERKVSAHIQQRFGPMWTGWHGWLQTIADAVKLLMKEDLTPTNVDKAVFLTAPFVVFVPSIMAYLVIPFSATWIVRDLNIGILYIFAITTLVVIAILMGGWSSNNKYSLLGGMRAAAQIISYEVPLVLSILGVVMLSGTLSMNGIVQAQGKWPWQWYWLPQILGFLIYLTAATAEVNRTPFDLPEGESELVAGFNTEYSGMKFAMFFLAEFANMFLMAAIATTLFLGGWQPFTGLLGFICFMIKSMAVVWLLMVFRWTYPRLRVDQLMDFGWKILVPLSFVNLFATSLIMALRK
jgi:NADH-quinone oxidoreductase subunit H